MPVHLVSVMSSSSSRPQLTVPSPTPFCPSSSSSNSRKFRGTFTQWHPARACHSGTWCLVNCQLWAAQRCGLLDERNDLAAKGHCLTSCSPGHTGETSLQL